MNYCDDGDGGGGGDGGEGPKRHLLSPALILTNADTDLVCYFSSSPKGHWKQLLLAPFYRW